MLIAGAKGHAKEILEIIRPMGISFCFFDNISHHTPEKLYGKYPVLRTKEEVLGWFEKDRRFVLGLGNPVARQKLTLLLEEWGGQLTSIISGNALIGNFNIILGEGLNVMQHVMLSNDVCVGRGSLLNTAASIHHDVVIGEYCEVGPGAKVLGGASIGNFSTIGAGAIILPNIKIGKNAIVGAGAVVTKNVDDEQVVAGNPARILNENK